MKDQLKKPFDLNYFLKLAFLFKYFSLFGKLRESHNFFLNIRNLFYAKIFIKIIELLHITKLCYSKFEKKNIRISSKYMNKFYFNNTKLKLKICREIS